MARILVTGASGFIGSHVARHLHALGHQVLANGRNRARLEAIATAGLSVRPGDLLSDRLSTLIDGAEVIVHCAALSSPWGPREDFMTANVEATQRLLDAARQCAVQRFVHFSSPSIYFRLADQWNTPEAFKPPRRWINAYAESKWLGEQCVRKAASAGLSAVVLRPRAVFGEGDRAIFPRLLALAERGWFPRIGNGEALIDVTYVANVAAAVEACLQPVAPVDGRAFNITNGEPMAVRELLLQLFTALDLKVSMIPLPRRLAVALGTMAELVANRLPGHPEPRLSRYGVGVLGFSQTLDISAARTQLGYTPTVSVADGIQRFARWWRSHERH
ncbi:NAD-dependent epimerase/dehydratase family protein [Rhodanobacter sp. AS-Z3]|uniref:NAD-dependent epimerase/dehydratase family protein n=1 Tax=Rhodanobacter sp. AS-Z3 TaxID=3031330 RepID=UPI00247AEEA1|nr:NAD-dependent epimerase/dehydratase family protein [Rhodanobacter sp. AS-Z3]WEN16358.1 NAD-dependent epimerase/dehydratase family protein [Rhodanobacter sp. AS-Z3]